MDLSSAAFANLYAGIVAAIPSGDISLDLAACTGTSIGRGTFTGTDSEQHASRGRFVSITLPDTVTTMSGSNTNDAAYAKFAGLKSFAAQGVTTLGNYVLNYCTSLITVNLPLATTFNIQAFSYCTSLTTVNLPLAATFGDGTFAGCTSLTTVNLPLAATFGIATFMNCTSLTTVTLGATPPTIGTYTFRNTGTTVPTITIRVPSASVSAYETWKTSNTSNFDLPAGKTVTIVGY
jgi:hypothetical protein